MCDCMDVCKLCACLFVCLNACMFTSNSSWMAVLLLSGLGHCSCSVLSAISDARMNVSPHRRASSTASCTKAYCSCWNKLMMGRMNQCLKFSLIHLATKKASCLQVTVGDWPFWSPLRGVTCKQWRWSALPKSTTAVARGLKPRISGLRV